MGGGCRTTATWWYRVRGLRATRWRRMAQSGGATPCGPPTATKAGHHAWGDLASPSKWELIDDIKKDEKKLHQMSLNTKECAPLDASDIIYYNITSLFTVIYNNDIVNNITIKQGKAQTEVLLAD